MPRSHVLGTTLATVLAFTATLETPGPLAPLAAQESRPADRQVPVILEDPPASTWKEVTFRPLTGAEIEAEAAFLEMVEREMGSYSRRLLQRSQLRGVVVVAGLRVEGQARAVVPDEPRRLIYVDPFIGAGNITYQRHALHHDFFHFLAARWEGDAYFTDPAWLALNRAGTRYGNGGKNAREGNQFALTHPAPGFVNLYAQSAIEEDMAEVFAMLQVPEERALLLEWATDDEVLRGKIAYIEAFLARHVGGATTRPAP